VITTAWNGVWIAVNFWKPWALAKTTPDPVSWRWGLQ